MINHLRTLLLNAPAAQACGDDYPGEEYTPTGYNGVALPSFLRSLHGTLFGFNPDRAYLNFRLRQYLGLIRSGDLAPDEKRHDKRITYATFNDAQLLAAPRVLYTPVESWLTVVGAPLPDDGAGRCYWEIEANVRSQTEVRIVRLQAQPQAVTINCSFENDLSSPIELVDGCLFMFRTDAVGQQIEFKVMSRPAIGLSQLCTSASELLGPNGSRLFEPVTSEAMERWRQIWKQRSEVVYRLPCIVLALGERIEERRISA